MGNGTHPIRGPQPVGSVSGLKLDDVRVRLTSTNPEKVAAAGKAYNSAATKISSAAEELTSAIKYIAERWQGPAAGEALQALRRVERTAQELAAKNGQTGKALETYGEKILPWYRSHLPDDGFVHSGSDDEYAQKFMARLNSRITQVYSAIPGEVRVDFPGVGQSGNNATSNDLTHTAGLGTGAGPAQNGISGAVPASRSTSAMAEGESWAADEGSGSGDVPGSSPSPSSGSAFPGGTALAGSTPVSGTGGGGGINTVGGVGAGSGPGYSAGGLVSPGPPNSGSRGGIPRGLGQSLAGGPGRGARIGPATPGAGLLGTPPGTGANRSGEERERSTWLTEDPDIWGAESEEPAPAIIGGLNPAGQNRYEDKQPRDSLVSPDTVPATGDSKAPGKDDLDALLDELEAELDMKIVDLPQEERSPGATQDPALVDDLGDLLDDLRDDTAGSSDPQTKS